MRDFKYSIWLENIFIRNITVTTSCINRSKEAVLRNIQHLYRKKWMTLTFKLEK